MNAHAREHVEIAWGERRTVAELRRTARRVLKINVEPSGHVIVFAPNGEAIDAVRERVQRKGLWVFRELDRIAARPSVTTDKRFMSGETHLVLGKPYRLTIEERDETGVRLDGTRMVVSMPRADDNSECRRLVLNFCEQTARSVFPERLNAMAPPFLRRGLAAPALLIRPMAKRWGSYTPSGRVVLNVDLVRASVSLIDYVICHELAHGFHADHSKEWRDLLSTVMPDWEDRKARLEALLR